MQVTLNTIKYQQNTPLKNNTQPRHQATPSFGGSGSLIDTFTSKSTFFEPVEKVWNTSTEWIAKNIIAKAMNSNFVGKFAEKTKDSKYIVNSSLYVIGEPRQSLVYVSDGNISSFEGKYSSQSLLEIRQNSKSELDCLDWSYKRIVKPHRAKVSLSEKVFNVKKYMTLNMLLQMDKDKEI